MNFCQKVVGNWFRLFQRVHNFLVVRVEEGVHDRIELVNKFIKIFHAERFLNFLNFFVRKTVKTFHVADKRQQIQFFRIDLLEKHCAVCLADDFCHLHFTHFQKIFYFKINWNIHCCYVTVIGKIFQVFWRNFHSVICTICLVMTRKKHLTTGGRMLK